MQKISFRLFDREIGTQTKQIHGSPPPPSPPFLQLNVSEKYKQTTTELRNENHLFKKKERNSMIFYSKKKKGGGGRIFVVVFKHIKLEEILVVSSLMSLLYLLYNIHNEFSFICLN